VCVGFIVLPVIITLLHGGFGSGGYSYDYRTPIGTVIDEERIPPHRLENHTHTIDYLLVFNTESGQVDELAFEDYIIGVVAAEMPALFEIDALKAQAIAARTYAVRHLDPSRVHMDLTDMGEMGQVFMTVDDMKARWGNDFNIHYNRIRGAVESTYGQLIWYDYEPIVAVFHATSSGFTEYSADVWVTQRPYLVSVYSGFDEGATGFFGEATFTRQEFITRFRSRFPEIEFSDANIINQITINGHTSGGAVSTVTVGSITIAGTELRSALSLRSSNFSVTESGDGVTFSTRGHGHGAGMSQTGANFLAQQGYTYIEILKHYYQGVTIW